MAYYKTKYSVDETELSPTSVGYKIDAVGIWSIGIKVTACRNDHQNKIIDSW